MARKDKILLQPFIAGPFVKSARYYIIIGILSHNLIKHCPSIDGKDADFILSTADDVAVYVIDARTLVELVSTTHNLNLSYLHR